MTNIKRCKSCGSRDEVHAFACKKYKPTKIPKWEKEFNKFGWEEGNWVFVNQTGKEKVKDCIHFLLSSSTHDTIQKIKKEILETWDMEVGLVWGIESKYQSWGNDMSRYNYLSVDLRNKLLTFLDSLDKEKV